MDDVTKAYLKRILISQGTDAYLSAANVVQTNMPLQFLGVDTNTFVEENIRGPLEKVVAYNKSINNNGFTNLKGRGLLLHGGAGSGKTALACLVLKNAVLHGFSGKFVLFETLANNLLQRDDQFDFDFLVVDGFGDAPNFNQSKLFQWVIGRLEAFLRERYYKMRPTIITTRLNRMDLLRVFPQGLVSFLEEATSVIDLSHVSDHRPKLKGKTHARRVSKSTS